MSLASTVSDTRLSGPSERENERKPICIDLFCGLGGWSEAFLAEGYVCIGFDIERHDYGTGGYPGQLVLQNVLSLHGSQFRDATVIVASPPCQAYSYRAMPWNPDWLPKCRMDDDGGLPINHRVPDPICGSLFYSCFRIQREACEAAGHHIPLIVENVRGAQKWVGRAKWHFGSYYLWGDVPALMPIAIAAKVPGFRFDGESHGSFQSAAVAGMKRNPDGTAHPPGSFGDDPDLCAAVYREGGKNGGDWFGSGENCSLQRKYSSRSDSRKAASALIAKIPFPLAQHIARSFLR